MSFFTHEPYFKPEQYILEGWLDVKSWESLNVSNDSKGSIRFGRKSFKKIRNRMHSWCTVYCTLDIHTSQFKYYKIRRCENDALPDLMTLTPKVAFFINESDIIDIPVNKHGKSDNFFINLDAQKQLLFSAKSESLKQRWLFTFQNMDDIRDDIVLANVNSPRKVFALRKSKSSAPRSFSRLPTSKNDSEGDTEDAAEEKLAQLTIACLEDSDDDEVITRESDEVDLDAMCDVHIDEDNDVKCDINEISDVENSQCIEKSSEEVCADQN